MVVHYLLHTRPLRDQLSNLRLRLQTIFIKIVFLLLFYPTDIYSKTKFTDDFFESVSKQYSEEAVEKIREWQRLIEKNMDVDEYDKLYNVNVFFNKIEFKEDIDHWKKEDFWATPIEFIVTGAGDCEDFTIAKYFTLLAIGVDDSKLRLMYVTATRPRQAHMVLAYYQTPDAIPLVLDNINRRILPATKRRDLIPVYSFNGEGLWLAKSQGKGRKMKNNNNSLWIDLNERMKEMQTNEK